MLSEKPPGQVECRVTRPREGGWVDETDTLAAEEPMEIRVAWEDADGPARKSIAITMRTPGDDFELAAGFLFGESVVRGREDVVDISYCKDEGEEQQFNIVTVTLRPGLALDAGRLERNFFTTSSCGICGKATLEALDLQGCEPLDDGFSVAGATLRRLPAVLRRAQAAFESTGGLHAAGLFGGEGSLLDIKEDVGRHNAVDKLVGARLLAGDIPLEAATLLLSGRASFELLQKALVARIPVVVAIGAPSSLAVQLAESFNITLVGFIRETGFNIYAGRGRVLA